MNYLHPNPGSSSSSSRMHSVSLTKLCAHCCVHTNNETNEEINTHTQTNTHTYKESSCMLGAAHGCSSCMLGAAHGCSSCMLGAAHAWLLLMHARSNHYQETPCNLACPTNVSSHHLANISVQASPILQICHLAQKTKNLGSHLLRPLVL
jgi:hypothetical protein